MRDKITISFCVNHYMIFRLISIEIELNLNDLIQLTLYSTNL